MNTTYSDQVAQAEWLARKAHFGQFRRDGVTPYIEHPKAVVSRLKGVSGCMASESEIAAAWLHDVLEDTETYPDDILRAGVSPAVLDLVLALSRQPAQSYDEFIARVSLNPEATKIKIADILSNLADSPTRAQIRKYAQALLVLTA